MKPWYHKLNADELQEQLNCIYSAVYNCPLTYHRHGGQWAVVLPPIKNPADKGLRVTLEGMFALQGVVVLVEIRRG